MTPKTVKYFTVQEANATLPYVRRVVQDVVSEYQHWRECIYQYEVIAAGSRGDGGETEEQLALRREVDEVAQRINDYISELAAVGCVFKGFEGGLVDFYGRREGRDVFLCWKLGEPEVAHWHELEAGFAGRQPLEPELVKGEVG